MTCQKLAFGFSLCMLVACQSDQVEPLALDSSCQPLLAGADCLLPYPSDYFAVPDDSMPSGKRIQVSGEAKMYDIEGTSANVFDYRAADGFSRIPSLSFVFPKQVSLENAPGILSHEGIEPSVADATVIVDSVTGELIAHYTDVDPEFENPDEQAVMLRVRTMLKAEHRYIVAVHGLREFSGNIIEAPEGFRRLRDRVSDESLEALQSKFDEQIFPVLTKAGIEREEIQLAWDFTTGSDEFLKRDLYAIRDQTSRWLEMNEPQITIKSVLADSDNRIETIVRGTITGPLFLEEDAPGALLSYDAQGNLTSQGTSSFDFLARIPKSVLTSSEAGGVMGFGHGLFGTRNEAQSGIGADIADRTRSILFAIDWVGMSRNDVLLITDDLISHPYRVLRFTERAHQAMANWIVLIHAVKNQLQNLPEFQRIDPATPLYDANRFDFLGISMGHILAGTLAALDPNIQRLCLNVGGAGFSHIVARSEAFAPFMLLMDTPIPSPLNRQKFVSTMQAQFDRIDAATYASDLVANDEKRILMQIALGDTTVPNVGSFLHARLLGLQLMMPSSYALPGLFQVTAPSDKSTLALFDFGIDLSVYESATPNLPKNRGHDDLRGVEKAVDQMERFFETGVIAHPCDGPCDPE
ncbi:MAG: hypothetical protein VYC39_04085 [Myxococcota bacterium]|nr:hypothetical protein [Myxococcota bacterium]